MSAISFHFENCHEILKYFPIHNNGSFVSFVSITPSWINSIERNISETTDIFMRPRIPLNHWSNTF